MTKTDPDAIRETRPCDHDRRGIRRSVGVLASLAMLLAGCVTTSGPSSRDVKSTLEASFLFRSSDLFFPDETIEEGEPPLPALTKRQVAEIQEMVDPIAKALVVRHDDARERIGRFLKVDLEPAPRDNVTVVNLGQPIAETRTNGEVWIDAKVLQAVFRSALATGLTQGPSISQPLTGRGVDLPSLTVEELTTGILSERTQNQCLAAFLEIRTQVRQTETHSHIGDLVDAFDDEGEGGDWYRMVNMALLSEPVSEDYFHTLLFLLAHEQGHVVLRHQRDRRPENDEQRGLAEHEADLYAFSLMASAINGPVIPLFQGPELESALGYRAFFTNAYSIAGFLGFEKTDRGGYPTRDERLELLDAVYEQFREAKHDQFENALIEAEERSQDTAGQ